MSLLCRGGCPELRVGFVPILGWPIGWEVALMGKKYSRMYGDLAKPIETAVVENEVLGEHVYCVVSGIPVLTQDLGVHEEFILCELFIEFEEVTHGVYRGNFCACSLGQLSVLRRDSGARGNVGALFLVDHEGLAYTIVVGDFLQQTFDVVWLSKSFNAEDFVVALFPEKRRSIDFEFRAL